MPFPEIATLSDGERVIVADFVRSRIGDATRFRVTAQPTVIEICSRDPNFTDKVRPRVQPLFSKGSDFSVVDGCRGGQVLEAEGFGQGSLRDEFLVDGQVNVDKLWGAIVNQFPTSCNGAMAPSSLKIEGDGAVRRFDSLERKIGTTPKFAGIVVKEKLSVSMQRGTPSAPGSTGASRVLLTVESEIFWRRASASEWVKVTSVEQLDPAMLKQEESTALLRCETGLVRAVSK